MALVSLPTYVNLTHCTFPVFYSIFLLKLKFLEFEASCPLLPIIIIIIIITIIYTSSMSVVMDKGWK